jgi:hypothetical protein
LNIDVWIRLMLTRGWNGEKLSGSVDSGLCGSILNVGESIQWLYLASVGNREIFTVSGFYSYCYILYTVWCGSARWVTSNINTFYLPVWKILLLHMSWTVVTFWTVFRSKWGTEYTSRAHKKLISTQHKLGTCDKLLFPLSQNIFGTKDWTHHHTHISFEPTIFLAYS